jgi:hypothetical protein
MNPDGPTLQAVLSNSRDAVVVALNSPRQTDQTTTIPLTLTSALRGLVTMYPPEIEHDPS